MNVNDVDAGIIIFIVNRGKKSTQLLQPPAADCGWFAQVMFIKDLFPLSQTWSLLNWKSSLPDHVITLNYAKINLQGVVDVAGDKHLAIS